MSMENKPVLEHPTGRKPREDDVVPVETVLSEKIAAECLCLLGNTYLGDSYAYLKLDAKDRKLTKIDLIGCYQYVQFINLSNNLLDNEQLKVLAKIPCVIVLEINENRLKSTAIPKLPFLQALMMKSNRITKVEALNHENLGYIDLENNQIRELYASSFRKLPNLIKLSMCSNLLWTTAGIRCESLVFLYLQNNQISKVEGLDHFVNLEVLNLRGNQIKRLGRYSFPASLSKLNYLNLRGNAITRIKDFRRLKHLPSLNTLICFQNAYDNYGASDEIRGPILVHLKQLRRLNKIAVKAQEWQDLDNVHDSSSTDSSVIAEQLSEQDVEEEENADAVPADYASDVSWALDQAKD